MRVITFSRTYPSYHPRAGSAYQRYRLEHQSNLNDDHLRKILKQEYPEATPEQIEEVLSTAKSRRK